MDHGSPKIGIVVVHSMDISVATQKTGQDNNAWDFLPFLAWGWNIKKSFDDIIFNLIKVVHDVFNLIAPNSFS